MFQYAFRSLSAVFTACYLIFSVGFCTAQPEVETYIPKSPDQPSQPESVNILQMLPEASLPLQKLVDSYMEGLPQESAVRFHVQTVSGDDYHAALHSKLLAGEAVDLFHLQGAADIERFQQYLEDLSTLPWIKEAVDGTLDNVTMNGAVYGLPYSLEGVGFVVNRAVFDAAEISLAEIHNFEDLSGAFMELRDAIDAGTLSESFPDLAAVTELAGGDSAYLGGTVSELLLAGSFSSPANAFLSSSVPLPNAAAAEEMMKLLARVSPHRGDWTQIPNVTRQQMIEGGLAAERVAVVLSNTEVFRRVYQANSDMEGKLALLPLYFPEYETGSIFLGAPAWWGIRASAEEPVRAQAKAFLSWLYHSEQGCAAYSEQLSALSPYQEMAASTGIALHRQLISAQQSGLCLPRLAPDAPNGWNAHFATLLQDYFKVYEKEWTELTAESQNTWTELRQS